MLYIPVSTLDCYLRIQSVEPSAENAVKIAQALLVSVEYLITGKEYKQMIDISQYIPFRSVLDDLLVLSIEILEPVKAMIKTAADRERTRQ